MSVTRVSSGNGHVAEAERSGAESGDRSSALAVEQAPAAGAAWMAPYRLAPPDDPRELEAERAEGTWFGRSSGRRRGGASQVGTSPLGESGRPLPSSVRKRFAAELGANFEQVRIHDSVTAARAAGELSAEAFTVGGHVVFGRERFRPDSAAGAALIRHELTHVLQVENGAPANVIWRSLIGSHQRVGRGGDRVIEIEMTRPASYAEFERDVLAGMARWVDRALLLAPHDPPESSRDRLNAEFRHSLRSYYYGLHPFPTGRNVTARIHVSGSGPIYALPETVDPANAGHGPYHRILEEWSSVQGAIQPNLACDTNCAFIAHAVSEYLQSETVARAPCEQGRFVGAPRTTVASARALHDFVNDPAFPDYSHVLVECRRWHPRSLRTGEDMRGLVGHAFVVARINGTPTLLDAQTTDPPVTTLEGFEQYWAAQGLVEAFIHAPGVRVTPVIPHGAPEDLRRRDEAPP